MNEIYDLAKKTECDFNLVSKMVTQDRRIGASHMRVPGPDGNFGFGGMCFPKDSAALLKFAQTQGVDLSVLEAAIKKNKVFRNDV